MGLLLVLVIGLIAGLTADYIIRGVSFPWWIDMFIGVVGAFTGNAIFSLLGVSTGEMGIIGSLISAIVGSLLLFWIISLITKQEPYRF